MTTTDKPRIVEEDPGARLTGSKPKNYDPNAPDAPVRGREGKEGKGKEGEAPVEKETTVEHTLSDVIENQQAEAAGQEVPNPDLPEFPDARQPQFGELGVRAGRPDEPVRMPQQPGHAANPLTPERLRAKHPDEDVEKLNFPEDTDLTLDDRTRVHFPAGHHEVPESVAKHPYLKASGVTKVTDPPPAHIPPTQHGNEKGVPKK